MKTPLISVIIPVYNAEKYIHKAIESVLNQGSTALEITVVDDGSTDGSAQAIQSMKGPIQYFYQQNKGPASARNLGLSHAQGDVIGFLDADDLWPAGKLALVLPSFQKNPALEILMGYTKPDMDSSETESQLTPHLGSALFRKSVFLKKWDFLTKHYK